MSKTVKIIIVLVILLAIFYFLKKKKAAAAAMPAGPTEPTGGAPISNDHGTGLVTQEYPAGDNGFDSSLGGVANDGLSPQLG